MSTVNKIQLICPIDDLELSQTDNQYVCSNGHSFDIAKQGYVNLLPVQHKRSLQPGDSKDMVRARTRFLDSGVYQKVVLSIISVLDDILHKYDDVILLDAGCGEGYYINYIQHYFSEQKNNNNISYLGLDISKLAVMAAAKRNKNITWVVGTNRSPPSTDNSIDIILCVFGFQSYTGFRKVLKTGGKIILVEPAMNHLKELRDIIYKDVKQSKATEQSSVEQEGFKLIATHHINFKTELIESEMLQFLLLMTPHFFRATEQGREKIKAVRSLSLTVDMIITVLEKS